MKEKIVIIGGGGHSKVLISIIKKSTNYDVIGYIDVSDRGEILGVHYLGDDNKLNELYNNIKNAALGIGQIEITERRYNLIENVKKIGFNFPSIISKDAIINEDVFIDEGNQIFDNVVINSGSRIGKFNIINTNSIIEHDCKIGNYCHIASNAVLSGGVEVGSFSMIGSNAVVVQYKKIGSKIMVGAGAVVTKDLIEEGVYVGNPARKIK